MLKFYQYSEVGLIHYFHFKKLHGSIELRFCKDPQPAGLDIEPAVKPCEVSNAMCIINYKNAHIMLLFSTHLFLISFYLLIQSSHYSNYCLATTFLLLMYLCS